MLQDPTWVRSEAAQGLSTPTNAYARNNPLLFTDPDGLAPTKEEFCQENPAACRDMHLPDYCAANPGQCNDPLDAPGGQGGVPTCSAVCAATAAAVFGLCMAQKQNLTFCRTVFWSSWTVCMASCLKTPLPNDCR